MCSRESGYSPALAHTIRRAIILREAVADRIADVVKIHESRNLADVFTKYLKYTLWQRHMSYILNSADTAAREPIEWRIT